MTDLRPGLATLLARTIARVKARGPRELGDLLVARVGEFFKSRETLIFFSRPAADNDSARSESSQLELQRADARDGGDYARFIGTDSPKTFASRLTSHTRCYLVRGDGKLLHASWVTTSASWVREIQRYFRVPEGDAYVYESFTRADARGQGVYPFALRGICTRLADEGLTRVWVGVEESNAPSRKAVAKAGFEPTFQVHYARRWGRLTVELSEGAKACAGCLDGTFAP